MKKLGYGDLLTKVQTGMKFTNRRKRNMKGNKPTLGNSTQKILASMPKEMGEEQEVAYRISGWVQIDNGWDSMENKPMEMTRDQQAQVDEVVSLMEKYNIQVSVQVQRKQGMEIKDYPVVAKVATIYE